MQRFTALILVVVCLGAACSDDTASDNNASNNGSNNDSNNDSNNASNNDTTTAPTITATRPASAETGVSVSPNISAVFSKIMDASTITAATFTLTQGATAIAGTVSYVDRTVTFRPTTPLTISTAYTATVLAGVKDVSGNELAADRTWNFTTRATTSLGPAPVALGTSGDFAILAKSGIDTVPSSNVTGDIGVSPIDSTAITGFSLSVDATNQFAISDQVTGKVFAADYGVPTPANLTAAISDMEIAYTDAAGRSIPDFTELGAGEIGGKTLVPGLYKWGTGVNISTDVTLSGGADDVWIFEIAGDITQANGIKVLLSGGAQAKNIFWQSFGQVMIGTNSHFEGNVLCETAIILGTGASVNGRLLAQTAVTLDAAIVTKPAL